MSTPCVQKQDERTPHSNEIPRDIPLSGRRISSRRMNSWILLKMTTILNGDITHSMSNISMNQVGRSSYCPSPLGSSVRSGSNGSGPITPRCRWLESRRVRSILSEEVVPLRLALLLSRCPWFCSWSGILISIIVLFVPFLLDMLVINK